MFPSRYWREIPQRYRLEAAKCTGCGKVSFPPRSKCPKCGGVEFDEARLPEKGVVKTFTIIRVAPSQFVEQAPYAVGIVELEGGVKITAQIVDCPLEDIKIGQKVRIEFRRLQEDGCSGVICYGYKCVPAL
ncbi:MAG: Zn-ribbon domain-containing OB-fold protein [Candidatus Eiseniibacteriota bacterium]|nr:MAG: Zn-ribbon domain-containing OB-fold protein [Candidatus Eisenbacteria bacterium]